MDLNTETGTSNNHSENGQSEICIAATKNVTNGNSSLKTESQVINFNAGPAKIAPSVLEKAQREIITFQHYGISVMEMSHRSAEFANILNGAKKTLSELVNIPDNYKILFLQGGATAQFSAVPLNLLQRSSDRTADYIVTGTWSSKAVKEAEKYGKVNVINQPTKKFTHVPTQDELKLNPNAAYVYYCDNETVNGVEFSYIPVTGDVPIVTDMTSNILTKPFDVTKFGVIIAGAQKNLGCAGVTLAIVRDDLVGYCMKECPTILDYKVQIQMNSLYNTPPTYSIYIAGLVLEWIQNSGGLIGMAKNSIVKSQLLYSLINSSNGFYCCAVDESSRSRINVVFRIGGPEGDKDLEEAFIAETQKANMMGLKGHRSVGGIGVSLYNAITIEETQQLADLMKNFQKNRM